MKLLNHSQTLTVISIWLIIHAGIKVNLMLLKGDTGGEFCDYNNIHDFAMAEI